MRDWTVTKALIIATPIIWILWDIAAYIQGGTPSTESATIWRWSYELASVPFLFGSLAGHLFMQIRAPSTDGIAQSWAKIAGEAFTLAIGGSWLLADLLNNGCFLTRAVYMCGHIPAIPLAIGMLVGFLAYQMCEPTEI